MQTVRRSVCGLVEAGMLLLAQPARSQQPAPTHDLNSDPVPYVNLGIESGKKGNLPEAFDFFNKAIILNPKYAPAYDNRGRAYFLSHQYDQARADYTRAIELDPKYTDAYYERGVIEGIKGDLDEAINDFNHVLALDPKHMMALFNRGHAKYLKDNLPDALADCTQAIALSPAYPYSYYVRGLVKRAQNNPSGALVDFQKAAANSITDGVLWAWLVKAESGQRTAADAYLAANLPKLPQNLDAAFTSQIGSFILGKITAEALVAQGKTGDPSDGRLCSACFFIGITKRLSGDAKGAREAFQNAVATGNKGSEEYIESQRELSRLPKP